MLNNTYERLGPKTLINLTQLLTGQASLKHDFSLSSLLVVKLNLMFYPIDFIHDIIINEAYWIKY